VRQGGVAFDVSLSRGAARDIQPQKTLVLTLPISGKPKDARAVPYTAMPDGKFALLPSRAAGADKLTIQLPHLSAKYITYVTDRQLLDAFDPEPVRNTKGKDCPQNVTVNGIKVKIDPVQNRGWSPKKANSAVFACLAASKEKAGYVRLNVANMIGYILAVKSSDNMRLVASRGGLEEELDKYVARHMPGSGDVQAFLGRAGKLVGSIDANSLYESGAKIELWADANTFWAESAIKVVGLLIGLLTGQTDAGKTLKVVSAALHVKEVIGCVEDAAGSAGDSKSALKFAQALFGCFGVIADAIGEYVDPLKTLGKFLWAVDAAKMIIEQVMSMINGGKLQLAGTLTATVTAEPPPCLSRSTALAEVKRFFNEDPAHQPGILDAKAEKPMCQGTWAVGGFQIATGDDTTYPNWTSGAAVYRFRGGAWKMTEYGQDMTGTQLCEIGPAALADKVVCTNRD
jgi:hypothetical protein